MSFEDSFMLKKKVALVTGAANGIGLECARVLGEAGAQVLATDREADACVAAVTALREEGLDVRSGLQDVTDEAQWQAAIEEAIDKFGGLDILVNNAGIHIGGTLESNTLEAVRRVHQVNVESIFLGMKHAALTMKPGGRVGKGGSIINLSSVVGLVGVPGHSAYGSTKGAVRLYTKHAAAEFGAFGYGIRVNSVHPGVITTSMGDAVFEDFVEIGLAPSVAEARQIALGMTSLGRLGTPRDVANMVCFLASDASAYVTGAEFAVDGGMSAR